MVLHSLCNIAYTHVVMKTILQKNFFARNTHIVARQMLGKTLVRKTNDTIYTGIITEVEAYIGEDDLACHASKGRTKRTEIMYGDPGHAYVYLIYGMYHCLNVVTEGKEFPAAVLIRAVEPTVGIADMIRNRNTSNIHNLTTGPGKLCQAMDVTLDANGVDMTHAFPLYIENEKEIPEGTIHATTRIGVAYAKHCANYPWRYYIKDSPFISKK